jgi:hypothetical protein
MFVMIMHGLPRRMLVIVAVLMISACAGDHRVTIETEHRAAAAGVSERIERLPRWPRDRNFTAAEWSEYAAVALVIRELPEQEMTSILDAWGEMVSFPGPGGWSRAIPWAEGDRLMILLRVLFQAPIEASEEVHPPPGVAPFGGIPAARTSPHPAGLGAPVWWLDGRPVLTAYRARGGGSTGPAGAFYFPIEEYNYFRSHYPSRSRDELLAVIDEADVGGSR